MVLCARVRKADGESAKNELKDLIDHNYVMGKTAERYLLIPLTEKPEKTCKFIMSFDNKNLQKADRPKGSLKDNLKGVIPDNLIDKAINSFDIIGDVAVIDVPKEMENYALSIAWTLKRTHKNIRTVAKRAAITSGKFRIRPLEVLTGDKNTETIYTESGIKLKLDLNKVYFSSRLGTERTRIADLVKDRENVLVLFAGCGPYAIRIAKYKKVNVTGIEWNPIAIKYFKENVKLNKVRVNIIKGDVIKVIPTLKEKFDRIIMPLPKQAEDYLDLALSVAKEGAIIHLYMFFKEDEAQAAAEKVAKKHEMELIHLERCGAFGPKIYRYCLDLK